MPRSPTENETQMVRLSAALWNAAKKAGVENGRSGRMEIEHRLQRSFGQLEDDVEELTWPRAVARLAEIVAEEADRYSRSSSEAFAKLQVALAVLLNSLLEQANTVSKSDFQSLSPEDQKWAESLGVLWAGNIKYADQQKRADDILGTADESSQERNLRLVQRGLALSKGKKDSGSSKQSRSKSRK